MFHSFKVVVLCILCISITQAQDFDNYQLLQNQGTIPEDFITPSTEKYEAEILTMGKDLRAREKKDQKQFYLETYFVVDDLLQSGKVLFGTSVNDYVNKVMDKLLVHEPQLKEVVRVYILRSSAVNAFATNQGIIFVNMGLLAQLENEAQLAFILAHELTHVKKSHSLNMYLEKKNIDRNLSRQKLLRETDFDEALVSKNRYSKELEFEADQGGLELYLKTDYSIEEIDGVFDVLKYAHLLFEIEPFDKRFFNVGELEIPKGYFLDSTKQIEAIDDEDDEESTHPATIKRLREIKKQLAGVDNSGKQVALVSEQEFAQVRKTARFELAYYYLHNFRYEDVIYTSFLLLKEHPNSIYLKKCIAKALHGMTKYLNAEAQDREDSEYQSSNSTYEDIEGPQQQVYHLISQLKNSEMTILALRYLWELQQEIPNDSEVNNLLESLFTELAYHYEEFDDLIINPTSETDTTAIENYQQQDSSKVKSKYDKIREKQQEEVETKAKKATYNFLSGLSSLLEQEPFKEQFEQGKKELKEIKDREAYYESEEGQAALEKYYKTREKKGTKLNIDSILVLNPFYLKLDARKDNAYKYVATEKGQQKLNRMLTRNAKIAGLNCQVLDVNKLEEDDTELFNEIAILNDWFRQQTRIGSLDMPGFDQERVDKIVKKYGTPYILKNGVIMLRKGKSAHTVLVSLLSIAFVITSPVGIATLAYPSYELLYFSVLYDVKNQQFEVLSYEVYNKRDSHSFLNAFIYDTFYQIVKK